MPTHKKLGYLLTLVDTYRLDRVIPRLQGNSGQTVAQVLLGWACYRPSTDNSPAFTSRVNDLLYEAFNISWKLCIPYRSQSSGKLERANRLIKQQPTKFSLELRLSRPSLLPIALTCLWANPYSPTGLCPFELLYRRPFLISHHLLTQTPCWAGTYSTSPSYGFFSVCMMTATCLLPSQRTQLPLSLSHSPWGT